MSGSDNKNNNLNIPQFKIEMKHQTMNQLIRI